MNHFFRISWLLAIVGGVLIYTLWLRELVALAWNEQAPDWFNDLISSVYPRFVVEKHRFDLDFFLRKADQVMIRFSLVNLVAWAISFWYSRSLSFREKLNRLTNPIVPVARVNWLTGLFFIGMIFFSYEWYGYLYQLYQAKAFYRPLPLLRVLHLPFPHPTLLAVLCGGLLLSCGAALFRWRSVFFSTLVAVLFVLLQGWLYSFEKMDHTFAPLTYAAMLMPFLLWERKRALIGIKGEGELPKLATITQKGWPLFLIQLSIGLIYLQAGLEKLLISGIDWVSPTTFRNYIYLHGAPLGLWVAQYDWLCVVLPLMALLFQLGFVLILFFPRLRWFIVPGGILFHSGTYLLFGVGWYFNAWIWAYLFFIPWEKSAQWFKKNPEQHSFSS